MKEIEKDFNILVRCKDNRIEIMVRKMGKDEMPDDGIVYYCEEGGQIYREDELIFND